MLQCRTQITTLHKVRAYVNIDGNEHAYTLAKIGHKLDHMNVATPYEHAHPAPYYLQRDWL